LKTLKMHLDHYLRLRRQLGYKLVVAGMLLRNFVRFAEQEGAKQINTKLALRWARLPSGITQTQKANRLGLVRRFAQYVSTLEPGTEVPVQKLIPYQFRRQDPYPYSEENVVRLVAAARHIDPANEIKVPTLGTLFGLLAVTGMRVGEAMALEREEVNFSQGMLTLHHAKGNKSRLIPLHLSTLQALQQYARLRDELYPRPVSPTFFVWEGGVRLLHCTVHRWFLLVACEIGLRQPGGRRGPRIHDLRHHFAIRTLLNWYQSNVDVEAHLPELATYLGHVHVRDSYWYLSAVPQLLELATLRWERAEKGDQ
jgi:integrase/recombinase XerD